MRADLNRWQSTQNLTALEFSPRSIFYHRLLGWTVRLLMIHSILSTMLFIGLRVFVAPALPPSALFTLPAPPPLAKPNQPTYLEKATKELLSQELLSRMRDVFISQLASLLLVHLFFVPPIRRKLTIHADGMKQLFNAIRDLAAGSAPKPLPAGQQSELGYLSVAFNDMACRLLAGRKELAEVNQGLERSVEQRTKELRLVASQLDVLASTDALTGLANRRCFNEQSESVFKRTIAEGLDLVCLLIDLDNFKILNDTMGHKAGDQVLGVAGEIFKAASRKGDLAVRMGGDEFVLIMPMADAGVAEQIADRLRGEFSNRMEALFPSLPDAKRPTMSVGIASRRGLDATTLQEMVASADAALYDAKKKGKNCKAIADKKAAHPAQPAQHAPVAA